MQKSLDMYKNLVVGCSMFFNTCLQKGEVLSLKFRSLQKINTIISGHIYYSSLQSLLLFVYKMTIFVKIIRSLWTEANSQPVEISTATLEHVNQTENQSLLWLRIFLDYIYDMYKVPNACVQIHDWKL